MFPELYPESGQRSTRAPGVDGGVELGVVVHLELTVEFEAPFAGVNVGPKGVKTGG